MSVDSTLYLSPLCNCLTSNFSTECTVLCALQYFSTGHSGHSVLKNLYRNIGYTSEYSLHCTWVQYRVQSIFYSTLCTLHNMEKVSRTVEDDIRVTSLYCPRLNWTLATTSIHCSLLYYFIILKIFRSIILQPGRKLLK